MRIDPGTAYLVAAAAVLATAIAGTVFVEIGNTRIGYDYGGLDVNGTRAVYAMALRLEAGDRLFARPELFRAPPGIEENYTFYVAGGGAREDILDGRAPERVFVRVDGLETVSCCRVADVVYDRQGTPPRRPDSDPSDPLADPAYVDLVWVFEIEEGFPLESRSARSLLASSISDSIMSEGREPRVLGAAGVMAVPIALASMIASAVVAMIAVIAWMRRLWRPLVVDDAGPTEAWLRLYAATGTYLTSVRDVLAAALLTGVIILAHALLVGTLVGAAPGRPTPLVVAFTFSAVAFYITVAAAAAFALWRIGRALKAWRRRTQVDPATL